MPSLLELQRGLRRALLGAQEEPAAAAAIAAIAGDGWAPAERLAIHRNNVVASLTEVLAEVFPVVRLVVDPRFFDYAACRFIESEPPGRPALAHYGARFPDFLAAFPPCRHLAYLGDLARLEWLLHAAAEAPEAPVLAADALAVVAASDAPHLAFGFQPAIGYLASRWPVDRIWQRCRCGESEGVGIDLDAGGVALEVRRAGGTVEMRWLPPAVFTFRDGLRRGRTLGDVANELLAEDAAFDLAKALADLVHERALIGFRVRAEAPSA